MRILKAIGNALWRPRQIMFINHEAGTPTRYLMIRPGVVIISLVLLVAAGFVGGFFQRAPTDPDLMPQYLQLQRDNAEFQTKLADREASISIMKSQIAQYEKDGKAMRAKIKAQGIQIDVYTSILDAMKQTDVQLIHTQATWRDAQTLTYNFIVVKGGNYPRSVVGYFKCFVTDPTSGKLVAVAWHNGQEKLPYKVVNDSFVNGKMDWKQTWRPTSLLIVRYDSGNKEKGRYTIAIQGATDETQHPTK